ncbi:hypothetical protein RRG08_056084 [Elysia crispata]|uniref:Uncharacterized protein n=1 Tax=Elysia crispata TaxID=231223 RepID=A0AAE1DDZ8_9GAST|nr:hypothetical protein RRG08_056084 [Elysia crispata]
MWVPEGRTGHSHSKLRRPRVSLVVMMVYVLTTKHVIWGQGETPTTVTTAAPVLPSTASASASALTIAASQGSQLAADYDYVETGPGVSAQADKSLVSGGVTTPPPPLSSAPDYDGLFYPLYGDPSPKYPRVPPNSAGSQLPVQPGVVARFPMRGLVDQSWGERGERGERTEWLRERLRKMWKFRGNNPAALTELQVLQKQFPGVNLTQIYNSYGMYGEDGFRGYSPQQGYSGGYGAGYGQGYGGGYGQGYGGGYGEDYGEGSFYYNGTWYPSYELEDWYYHNGTWYPTLGDWEDGYFHNGTWYPGMDEMDEWYYHNGTWYPSLGDWEDGYFHNGTWYPGLEDMLEDGYYYNGTWYPGWGDAEDGYYYNGTWYPGYETEDMYEREGPEQEDLMWWQLHHPRWSGRDGAAGQDWSPYSPGVPQRPPYAQVPPLVLPGSDPAARHSPQLQLLQRLRPELQAQGRAPHLQHQRGASPFGFLFNNRGRAGPQTQETKQAFKPPASPNQQRPNVPSRPLALPVVQQAAQDPGSPAPRTRGRQQFRSRPPPPGYVPRGRRGGATNPRGWPQTAKLAGKSGGRPPPPPPPFGRRQSASAPHPQWKPNQGPHRSGPLGAAHHSHGPGASPSGRSGDGGPAVKVHPSSPLDPYRSTATVTVGIVIACLVGLTLVVAPLLCLLHKYRQEKRVKKRTFLRRAEHGSIDEGIMDAMVMSELGERRGSRVAKLGARGGRSVWKGGHKAGRTRADLPELQPLDTISGPDRELGDLYSTIP